LGERSNLEPKGRRDGNRVEVGTFLGIRGAAGGKRCEAQKKSFQEGIILSLNRRVLLYGLKTVW